MKKTSYLRFAVALACSMVGVSSFAQPYVGVSVGPSKIHTDCGGLKCDLSDTAVKIMGGYMLSPNWAVEASYGKLGKATANDGSFRATVEVTGLGLGAAYHLPFSDQFSGVIRLGISANNAEIKSNEGFSNKESSTKPYFGVGVNYAVTKQLSIGAGYDRTSAKIDTNADVDAFVISTSFRF